MNSIKLIIDLITSLKDKLKEPFSIVNLICDVILAIVPLVYCATDVIKHLIFGTISVIKTGILGKDINYAYIETSYFSLFIPCIGVTFFCLLYLMWFNAYKNNVFKKK